MGTSAYPGTVDKARRLAVILSSPVRPDQVSVFDGLLEDDDFSDKVTDLERLSEDADITGVAAGTLNSWLDSLDTFSEPWEPEAVEIVRRSVSEVDARFDAQNDAWITRRGAGP